MLQSKFWQAFFAIAPLLLLCTLFCMYAVFIMSLIWHQGHSGGDWEDISLSYVAPISGFLLLMLTVLISLASFVFYIIHAVQNPSLQNSNLLIVWIILFIFVGGISQFLYWIIEIVNKREPSNQT